MNREIKFRAWDEKLKLMYATDSVSLCIDGEICYLDTDGEWVADMANRITLMQYTGLKDKNGKEIYEGDIVKHQFIEGDAVLAEEINVVIYEAVGAFAFAPTLKHRGLTVRDFWHRYKSATGAVLEVIGNIYENPELLEVENE